MSPYEVALDVLKQVKELTEQEHQDDWKLGEDRSLYKEGEYEANHKETMSHLDEAMQWVERWKDLKEDEA